jgi:hypothetical protein
MTTRVRLVLLACTALVGLAFASSALAAFTPALAIGHQPPTLGSTGTTSIRLTVPRDDDALARASIYVAPGYSVTTGQAPGTSLGTATAQILVREPIAGVVLPLTGTLAVADPAALVRPTNTTSIATTVTRCTGTPTHNAIWLATLQASGQNLDVPIAVDAAPAPLASVASYVLTFCLPNPNIPLEQGGAPFGAKLVQAQLNYRGNITAPTSRGTYRWHVVATPWSTTANAVNVLGTVDAQARAMLPGRVTLSTSSTRRHVLTIRGSVLEGDTGVAQRSIVVRVGNKRYNVRTNAGGAYRLVVRFRRPTRVFVTATANVPARSVPCSTPSPFPGVSCVSETLQFFLATRTLRTRIR